MQKFLFLFLIVVIFAFQLENRYGSGGAIDDSHVKQQIAKQIMANQELVTRNNEMILKTEGLKGSPEAIEARARLELNMVKSGETLILLPGNNTNFNVAKKVIASAKVEQNKKSYVQQDFKKLHSKIIKIKNKIRSKIKNRSKEDK